MAGGGKARDGKAREGKAKDGEARKPPAVQAWLVGAAATLGALATLITNIGAVRNATCSNVGVFCRPAATATAPSAATPALAESTAAIPVPADPRPYDPSPYGVELTALTDPVQAVLDTDKARSVAPPGAEIRLYKRMTRAGTIAWAPVIIYTDSSVASTELARFKVMNGWEPDLVTIRTWCPKARPIPSPTGTPIKVAVIDCT